MSKFFDRFKQRQQNQQEGTLPAVAINISYDPTTGAITISSNIINRIVQVKILLDSTKLIVDEIEKDNAKKSGLTTAPAGIAEAAKTGKLTLAN